ncbi:beta-1,4-galactosyltransferase galt-1-like [Rhinatrema bivittatum]|uniref:beta-1,4-galactosyltransferase galt-1-like n=1 Tax=Rhinatrema bivittatum TaxID=194408 RepID=UPI00112DAB44|nr:beta-1,4-galactosyltransferase galt-1-like [Rhinatrema bivittatum]
MFCPKSKGILYTSFTLVCMLVLIFTCYYWSQQLSHPISVKRISSCRGRSAQDTITPLSDNKTFIISAYLDHRENITRVLSIIQRLKVKQLYCWFCCSLYGNMSITVARINVGCHQKFPYSVADVLCLEPSNCDPKYVSIHWSPEGDIDQLPTFKIRNREPNTFFVEFTVCISTMFGNYNNVLQFIQAIEMYKLLGAQKVMIYKTSCSQLIEKVLQYYTSEGTVEVLLWPINEYLNISPNWHYMNDGKDIGYFAQLATLNDCIYRNMYRSKFVVLIDIDEIILPQKHQNWKEMMDDLQEEHPDVGIFLFQRFLFPVNTLYRTDAFNISSWTSIPGVNILQHIYRESLVQAPGKLIVDPRKVIHTTVHRIIKGLGKTKRVPLKTAFIQHCRTVNYPKLHKDHLIKERILWRYNSSLIRNVNKIIQNIIIN